MRAIIYTEHIHARNFFCNSVVERISREDGSTLVIVFFTNRSMAAKKKAVKKTAKRRPAKKAAKKSTKKAVKKTVKKAAKRKTAKRRK